MRIPKVGMIGMAILGAVGLAGAHLTAGSLSIKSTDTFVPGAEVTLSWNVTVAHPNEGGINIDISTNGGSTWASVKNGLPDASGKMSYKLTMPNQESSHAKIRLCQGSRSACDTVKTERPGSGSPYSLFSPEFKIAGTSSIQHEPNKTVNIGFNPKTLLANLAFSLGQDQEVLVQVLDVQGRVQRTLLNSKFRSGDHLIEVGVPAELASSTVLILRLKIGETVSTESFTQL
jgi:hypothetical protein